MNKRESKCGTSASEGELARLELRALGHRDADNWTGDFCIGFLHALKDAEQADRLKGTN